MSQPPSNVKVSDQAQEVESSGDSSTSQPSNATTKLASLFPTPKPSKKQKLADCPMFLQLLNDVLMLDELFITRMEAVGFVTPAIIVNRFGLTNRDIAHSHALSGAHHLHTTEFEGSSARLILFARGQLTNGKVSLKKVKKPHITWKSIKKTKSYKDEVKQWDEDTLEAFREQVTDPLDTSKAVNDFNKVRSTVNTWVKNGKVPHKPLLANSVDNSSLASTVMLPTLNEEPEEPTSQDAAVVNDNQEQTQNSDEDLSFTTADTPLKQTMTMVKGMNDKWDSSMKDIQKTVKKTATEVNKMKQQIKNEVGTEVNNKLNGAINQRAKEAVAMNLDNQTTGKIIKSLDAMFHQAQTPLESPLEKLQKEGGIEAITSILTSKPKQKHRSHVTWKTPGKGGHKQPKSPLDPDFFLVAMMTCCLMIPVMMKSTHQKRRLKERKQENICTK